MRMRNVSRVGALLAVCLLAQSASAATMSSTMTAESGPVRKLSRGLANTFAGVLEIPLAISRVGKDEGPVAAFSWGLLQGVGAAWIRTFIGVMELATFPVPLPKQGYEPILEPEFLFEP